MSQFSRFVPTKDDVKLANENTGHYQVIAIILCCFTNRLIIYPMGKVYYYLGHPSNKISYNDLKCYADFENVTSETIEHYDLFDPQGHSWRPPYQTRNNLYYLKIKKFKVNS